MSPAVAIAAFAAAAVLTAAGRAGADSIPPNCTLDPFTHTMNCHLPPNCTMDPFTHTMNCYPPKKVMFHSSSGGTLHLNQPSASTLK